MHALYLILDLGTLSIPLLWSFGPRIAYYRKWKALFPAIAITGAIFIAWDVAFTAMGVWGFNPRYLTGIVLLNLPLEEWLFFICIPYSSVFIYESLNHFVPRDVLGSADKGIAWTLAPGALAVALYFHDRWYTATTFALLGGLLLLHLLVLRTRWLGRFFLAYGVVLIPFFIVNGLLTGAAIDAQVVWYDDAENLGIRLGTIPLDDVFYGMALILMNVTIMEALLGKRWEEGG